jgi:hypothetical protein
MCGAELFALEKIIPDPKSLGPKRAGSGIRSTLDPTIIVGSGIKFSRIRDEIIPDPQHWLYVVTHHFYAALAPALGKNFDAALAAPSPVSNLTYNKPTYSKRTQIKNGRFLIYIIHVVQIQVKIQPPGFNLCSF